MFASRTDVASRPGTFNYLAATTEPSLIRNGRVLTQRNSDGSDGEWRGVQLVAHTVAVSDARSLDGENRRTLQRNGFELLAAPIGDSPMDFLDHEVVVRKYYEPCAELVREASGASVTVAFDHNVRSASGKAGHHRISGGQQVQGPAHIVHGDYTLTSAPQRLRDLTKPPSGSDTLAASMKQQGPLIDPDLAKHALQQGRFAIINVWRNIVSEPVLVNPLALCDAAQVEPDDLVVFEIHYDHRIGENYFARHSARHRWYFFPEMVRDEALLIKQWDSAGRFAESDGARGDRGGTNGPCTFSFHSAFADSHAPDDAPDRWSIEVRCIAIY